MLYKVLERMIERGQTDVVSEKIDVFYAVGKITEKEYKKLLRMIGGKK